jgi:hypothetical protein
MGGALPGAIAASLVHPDRKVLAIAGDGGFLMNVQEMETAKRLGASIVVMVWEDGGYGLIAWTQGSRQVTQVGSAPIDLLQRLRIVPAIAFGLTPIVAVGGIVGAWRLRRAPNLGTSQWAAATLLGAPTATEEANAQAMLARLRTRGADQTGWWSGESELVGVCRADWELGRSFAGGVMVLEDEHLVIAADASLYYVDDLRRSRSRRSPRGDLQPTTRPYRVWGDCARSPRGIWILIWDWHHEVRRLGFRREQAAVFQPHSGRLIILESSGVAAPGCPRIQPVAIGEDPIGAWSGEIIQRGGGAARVKVGVVRGNPD